MGIGGTVQCGVPDGIPLGPYVLLRRLARGGMAEIFLARKDGPQGFTRDLVVKRVLPHLSEADEFQQMFREEARIVARLTHPNVVQVYDFGEVGGTAYLVMELVRGVDLRALIDRAMAVAHVHGAPGALPAHHAVKILSFVCEGLAQAHDLADEEGRALGLVHRDVTPSNVLISFDGAVKVADFGIAKLHRRRDETQVGKVRGKFAYLSPEQARGEPLDRRSDLFNVGSLLFESLTGDTLFPHEDQALARACAAAGKIPDADRLKRVPPGLWRVLEKVLAADRTKRHPDALALRLELEAFLRSGSEPSDQVELGRYVRGLFPDVLAQDRAAPRAAGTVPLTAHGTPIAEQTVELPAPLFGAQADGDDPWTEATGRLSAPSVPESKPVRTSPSRWPLALGAVVLLLASMGFGLYWFDSGGPPAAPAPTLQQPTAGGIRAPTVVPSTGRLRIATEPAGLTVWLDGEARGQAPLLLEAEAGLHQLEARRDGRVVAETSLTLAAGQDVAVELSVPTPAVLTIASIPAGARVRIASELVGHTPLELEVEPGTHQVEISEVGFEPHQEAVSVTQGGRSTLSVALRPERAASNDMAAMSSMMVMRRPGPPGTLAMATTPWCEVWLRGRKLGTTPFTNVSLPAGRHQLELRRPGAAPVRRTVVIRSGEQTRARFSL